MFFLKSLPTRNVLIEYKKRFPNMDIEAVESALNLLRQASLLERHLDAYFSTQGLSQLRFLILIVLDRENRKASLKSSDIADRLDISRPVMTRTIQALEKAKAVCISEDEFDGRAKVVSLTDCGRSILHNSLPGYYDIIRDFMERNRDSTVS